MNLHATFLQTYRRFLVTGLFAFLLACGGDDPHDATNVTLGETTFVVVVNPTINDVNAHDVSEPGTTVEGVRVDGGGRSVSTSATGVGVLSGVEPGSVTLQFGADGIDEELTETISNRDLIEIAVAVTPDGASRMARVVYAFGAEVVELGEDSTNEQVNDALSASNRIVLLSDGVYTGDLELSGSSVTLFGASTEGGRVTIDGNVSLSGSGNRIRGAHITGDVEMSGSNQGLSFSTIDGLLTVSGSDSVLLNNTLCGQTEIGDDTYALGNRGLAPLTCP